MKKNAPTATQIDVVLAKHASIAKMITEYESKLEPLELEIIGLVDRFGSSPKNAERSKELAGEIYRALVTRGISVKVCEKRITKFRADLKKAGASHFFRHLFTEEVSHKINPGAALFLAKLPDGNVKNRVRAGFMAAQELKEQNPRLKVSEVEKKKEASA